MRPRKSIQINEHRKQFLLKKIAKFGRINKRQKIVSIDYPVLDNLGRNKRKWLMELKEYDFLVQSAIPCSK